jgi:hypothetical protein
MVTGRFALLAVAVVAVPAVAWGLIAGGPAPNDVPLAPSRVDAPTSMTAPSQQPTVPAPESSPPLPQTNITTPQQSSSIPPPPGSADTNGPTVRIRGHSLHLHRHLHKFRPRLLGRPRWPRRVTPHRRRGARRHRSPRGRSGHHNRPSNTAPAEARSPAISPVPRRNHLHSRSARTWRCPETRSAAGQHREVERTT